MNQTNVDQPLLELPIACTLGDEDLRRRSDEIARLLEGRQEVRQLSDGYALRFRGTKHSASRLLAFIMRERACCPFFTFELIFEPQQGPIWLHLRGPAGTLDFLAEMLERVKQR